MPPPSFAELYALWSRRVKSAERTLSRALFHRCDRDPQTRAEPHELRELIAEVRRLREMRDRYRTR